MRYKILLSLTSLIICVTTLAQNRSSTAFAITSDQQGQAAWTEVKLIDLNSGQVLKHIFQNNNLTYSVWNARSGKQIQIRNEKGLVTDNNKLPFATFSAACAYDKRHNRLYYTPMFINQLRYIDLDPKSAGRIYYFENENFSSATNMTQEANQVTRMVIGADGHGYALTNDGNHLVRFTTGRIPIITDLGAVRDDASNDKFSLHNSCTSAGGDMVAAANGDLYLISARHAVFKIDIRSRIATYLDHINGLPNNVTTNGAVVDDEGFLVVSSANSIEGYYRVDMHTWQATRIDAKDKVFNTSDLANGNLAFEKEAAQQRTFKLFSRSLVRNDKIAIYPNPVSANIFRISFDSREFGRYDVQLVDILGRILTQKTISITNVGQVTEIQVPLELARGTYLVKVLNNNKKTIFADRILLQ